MLSIRKIVQQAIATGYLTVAAEEQLRQLLQTTKYGWEDINAFISLQEAAMSGCVKQESRQLKHFNNLKLTDGEIQTMEFLPYRNALEPIVADEVKQQIQDLPPKLVSYINPAQVIAFALNQLPPLYCTSQRGWELQQRKAKEKLTSQIHQAVYRGLLILQADPFKPADLKFREQNEENKL